MNKLKFSRDFNKLPVFWEGTQVVLIGVQHIKDMDNFKKLLPQLIKVDTMLRDGGEFYPLDFKEGLLVTLFHINPDYLFTTFRRYTEEKYRHYNENIGETFELLRA